MTLQLFAHEEFDAHERVVFGFDAETGLRALIAIHSTRLGRRWAVAACTRTPTRPRP